MKNTHFVFLFLLLISQEVFPQFYQSQLNKAPEEDLDKRNDWLFKQRLFPFTDNGMDTKGFKQREFLRLAGFTDNSSSWVSLGPNPGTYNLNPATSRIRVIAYDPDSTNTIYIGTSNGGVWKTTNGGNSWIPKTDFEPSLSSGALAVYNNWSTNPPQRIVYYGTGEGGFGFVYSYYGKGLLKSTDGGDTWRQITNGLPSTTYFYKIAINPASPNILLAALGSNYANPVNNGGLYRSTDFGESWTRIVPVSSAENGLTCNDVIFSSDGTKAYIIGPFVTGSPNWWENGTGYRISNDGGATFSQVSTNLPGTGYLAVHPLNQSIMYALTAADCNTSMLYRSVDAGNTWAWLNSNFSSNQCGYNMSLTLDPSTIEELYVGTVITYKTTDRGNNFVPYNFNFHFDVHDIEFNPRDPSEFLIATDGGVLKIKKGTPDAVTNLNQTISSMECYSIGSDPNDLNHMLAGTQDNGVQRKSPAAIQWSGISGYDATNAIIDENNSSIYIAQFSATPTGIHVSTNGGSSWIQAGGFRSSFDYPWVRPIVRHPSVSGRYYTVANTLVYVSTDFGVSWSNIINTDITDKIESFGVSKSNPRVMYASTGPFEYMPNSTIHNIYKSVNEGQSWVNITSNVPNRYVSAIAIDDDNENDVIVALSGFGTNHLYHSLNGGQSWITMDCNGDDPCLPDVPFNDLIIYKNPLTNIKEYYAATDAGVFVSSGESLWHELYGGLPNVIVMDLEIVQNKLRAATFGRGIFEWDLTATSQSKKNTFQKTISSFIDANNYPNPFNPTTDISVTLKTKAQIKITVYDINGKTINVLANGIFEPNDYRFKWNAEKYASGVYFYSIEANGFRITKKMLLLK